MSKKLLLSIPKPCHENWDAMTPVQKGKFCGSCQKEVMDFSTMSDREIAQFFRKPSTGSVCGRFTTDQLDRAIDIPKKRIPWLKYFFQVTLPALFVSKAVAQNEKTKPDSISIAIDTTSRLSLKSLDSLNVTDAFLTGDTIVFDTPKVVLKSEIRKEELIVGNIYTFPPLEECTITMGMTISSIDPPIIAPPVISPDIFSGEIKVFPNPARPGSSINLSLREIAEGYYGIYFMTLSGQIVKQEEIWIDADAGTLNLNPMLKAGSYFMILTNKKTGKKFSEKIIIQ